MQANPGKPIDALVCGYISTFCFAVQYIPQTILNFKRGSIAGFSTTGIIIKLVGSALFAVNSLLISEALPTTLYGISNVVQHSVFMGQFTWYTGDVSFLAWIAFPLLPLFMAYTGIGKPASQFLSHLPQLYVSYKKKSTEGVSLASQHLNFLGGTFGLYMFTIFPPKSMFTYMVYLNSIFQALSIYYLTVTYDGWSTLWKSFSLNNFIYPSASHHGTTKELYEDYDEEKAQHGNREA